MSDYDVTPLDSDESRDTTDWSIDPYYSGPDAGDNPDRHKGFDEFDRITTPAERATMPDPELADTVEPGA
jgi:hypothetical protein